MSFIPSCFKLELSDGSAFVFRLLFCLLVEFLVEFHMAWHHDYLRMIRSISRSLERSGNIGVALWSSQGGGAH